MFSLTVSFSSGYTLKRNFSISGVFGSKVKSKVVLIMVGVTSLPLVKRKFLEFAAKKKNHKFNLVGAFTTLVERLKGCVASWVGTGVAPADGGPSSGSGTGSGGASRRPA